MKVKTAITIKPTFTTKLSYKWKNYRYVAFPNTIFEYYYWKKQYCANVTITASKVSGISGYNIYYGEYPNKHVKASKRTNTYTVAHADSKSKLRKTQEIWVRTYNEFKSNGMSGKSYGPWVKKTVKLR